MVFTIRLIKNPKYPSHADIIITANLSLLNENANSSLGMANEQSAVNANRMTTIGLTKFASTAACPIMRPPTMPIVFPMAPGSLMPASRSSSKDSSIMSTSMSCGNGQPSLAS